MKKYLSTILAIASILLIAGIFFIPQIVMAQASIASSVISLIAPNAFNNIVTSIGNTLLTFTSWTVTIGGLFLSISMNLTLHIKELYESIPAIESTWVTIRDLSSIFIIFMLLYSAIIMILGVGKGPSFGSLVIKIFIAGMLINFSLFFVRVAIDASNLISLQFYNAIAPTSFSQKFDLNSVYTDGGLSNVFMQSLKIPKIYDNKSWLKDADTTGAIVLATFGGAILMITAAFSFFAAAIAFTLRTGLLVFIMALSPLFFVAMIFPKVEEKSNEMLGYLKSQLIFMPVYLGLMYVALRVISDQGFMSIFNASTTNASLQSGNAFGFTMAGVVIQYTIAALFINAPLVAAIKAGAWGASWAPKLEGIAKKITGNYGANLGKWAGRNTYGAAAASLAESNFMKTAASKNFLAAGALKSVRGVAKSYSEFNKTKGEERTKFGESLGYNKQFVNFHDSRIAELKDQIDAETLIINRPGTPANEVDAAEARKKRLEKDIRMHENKIADEKRRRQTGYASRLDPRDIDPSTGKLKPASLWQRMKKGGTIGRDETIGSSQIHVKNTEAEIEQLKKALDDKKKDQDTIKADIKRIDERERQGQMSPPEDTKRGELKADLYKLLNGEPDPSNPTENIGGLNNIAKEIRDKELEVKRYKNLT